jgi:hypothetical protein
MGRDGSAVLGGIGQIMKLPLKSFNIPALLLTCALGICGPARGAIVQNSIDPFELETAIDCNGDGTPEDVIDLVGNLHTLITETVTKSGRVSSTAHFQPVNVSAVGAITGDTYRAVGLTRSTDVLSDSHESYTFVNDFYLIGQKSGIKYLVHETFHVTVVDGEVVVSMDHFETRCR